MANLDRAAPHQSLAAQRRALRFRMQLDRAASHLHGLGLRATVECLADLAEQGDADLVLAIVRRFGSLTPAMIRAAGDDGRPLRRVRAVPA